MPHNDITYCTSTTCPIREICKRADIPKVSHWLSMAEFEHTDEGCNYLIEKK